MSGEKKLKPVPRWGFMARTKVFDYATGEYYLSRLRIIETPWFAIFLHRLGEPDPGIHLHDHPWYFKSFILWGGYDEEHANIRDIEGTLTKRRWSAGSVHSIGLDQAHRISFLHALPTWTLLFVGRRVRDWGFYTTEMVRTPFGNIPTQTFVHHSEYDNGLRTLDKRR